MHGPSSSTCGAVCCTRGVVCSPPACQRRDHCIQPPACDSHQHSTHNKVSISENNSDRILSHISKAITRIQDEIIDIACELTKKGDKVADNNAETQAVTQAVPMDTTTAHVHQVEENDSHKNQDSNNLDESCELIDEFVGDQDCLNLNFPTNQLT